MFICYLYILFSEMPFYVFSSFGNCTVCFFTIDFENSLYILDISSLLDTYLQVSQSIAYLFFILFPGSLQCKSFLILRNSVFNFTQWNVFSVSVLRTLCLVLASRNFLFWGSLFWSADMNLSSALVYCLDYFTYTENLTIRVILSYFIFLCQDGLSFYKFQSKI